MCLSDPAGANKQHIVVAPQKCPLRQLEKADLGDTRDQRKIKVFQPFLVGEGRGFETLAQLLLLSLSQFPFKQRLQVAQVPQSSLLSFAGQGLTIRRHPREPQLLEDRKSTRLNSSHVKI